jgi:hypothetical protein
MKIVLAMGSAIVFTIANLIVILILAIPLVLLGVTGFFIGKAAGFTWDISTQLLLAALGLLVFAGILYAVGFIYAPGLVFFQSYTVEFFAARYTPLGTKLSPAAAPPVMSPTGSPPSIPPLFPGSAFRS